jgi:thiol-disulfide isomerase/thioredoxin/predicted regulator of Ras-like GTPase activity (Roadblock/LC7/MglB family)
MVRRLLAALAATVAASPLAWALEVGEVAPPIQAKKWASNTPVTLDTAKGKVLVVEFWATWCGPCRQTIPHLNKLHKKYSEKEAIFVGMTEEDEPTVKKFMEGMAMDYHVGLDDASKTNDAYMKGITGIPHAFAVGRDGKVVWHGHPLAGLDRVVEQLVAGTFNVERAKKLAALQLKLQDAARGRDMAKLLETADQTIREVPDDPDAYRLKRAILRDQGKADETWDVLLAMAAGCPKDADVLVEVALTLSTTGELEHRDLAKALEFAKQAVVVTENKNPGALATLARVHFELGHLVLAAETAAQAVKAADEESKKRLESHADFYRKELERRRKDAEAKF